VRIFYVQRRAPIVARRVLISGYIGAAVVICMTAPTASFLTRACPPPPPQPLRTLYLDSDLIIVAQVGATTLVREEKFSDFLKTSLIVSSVLKGETAGPVVSLYNRAHRGNRELAAKYKQGESLLLFLQETGEGYALDDPTYCIKRLSAGDLQIYLERIAELDSILQQAPPDNERLVEWLVRCAEEPATRWEGAYELAMSAYDLDADMARSVAAEDEADLGEDEADLKVDAADGQQAEEEGQVIVDDANADPIFILLLTEGQKERLATALFNSSVIGNADEFLIRVVETWNPPRLKGFLMTQLSQMRDKAPLEAQTIMEALSRIIGDRSLARLAEAYFEDVSYEDLDVTDDPEASIELSEAAVRALKDRSDRLKEFLSVAEEKRGSLTSSNSARECTLLFLACSNVFTRPHPSSPAAAPRAQ
jgi:hypothetical protein